MRGGRHSLSRSVASGEDRQATHISCLRTDLSVIIPGPMGVYLIESMQAILRVGVLYMFHEAVRLTGGRRCTMRVTV
jgi:hypothetical protein